MDKELRERIAELKKSLQRAPVLEQDAQAKVAAEALQLIELLEKEIARLTRAYAFKG